MSIHLPQDRDKWMPLVNTIMPIHLTQDRDQWRSLVNVFIWLRIVVE
jgi:hypothetical protein